MQTVSVHYYCPSHLKVATDALAHLSDFDVFGTGSEHKWESDAVPSQSSSVCGIHRVDVAVQLMSERQPGFGGEVDLWASTAFTVAAPGRCGWQTWLWLLCGNWMTGVREWRFIYIHFPSFCFSDFSSPASGGHCLLLHRSLLRL